MVAAFPAAKLAALLIKQASKPIATFCKNRAKSHPFFRTYICMPPAHFYNWCEVQMKMWILNLGKPVNVPVLNEAQAIELGANLLGESILFLIAAGIVVSEYNRSARKEEKKERLIQEEKAQTNKQIEELYFLTQKQSAQITELLRHVYDLESRSVQKPWVAKKEPENLSKDSSFPRHRPPPGPPSLPNKNKNEQKIESDHSDEVSNEGQIHGDNIVLKAANSIPHDLWSGKPNESNPSILTVAINYIYKDVYRLSLSL